jgi:hypothetical protein
MTSTFEIELGRSALGLRWPDGNRRDYPYIWLRDSDPAAFHPDTKERTGDLLEHPRGAVARPPGCRMHGLDMDWQDGRGQPVPCRLAGGAWSRPPHLRTPPTCPT